MVNRGADEKAGKRTQGCKDQEDHGHPGHVRRRAHFREEIREALEARFAAIQRVMWYNEEREEIEISTHASANTIGLQSLPSSGYSRKKLAGLKRTPRTVLTKLPAGFESTTFKTSRGSYPGVEPPAPQPGPQPSSYLKENCCVRIELRDLSVSSRSTRARSSIGVPRPPRALLASRSLRRVLCPR